ncbi:methyltransferase family protein [Rhodopila sp.]|jgi:protein-S-isoprenylcysteine O-methyltransferase Ste14|uniref:methyltransferase family protein n=1 Tax=Rhodopila sp. TaxID=2480087 RepID=UPI002BA38636|nr:isoprenylcysteine carboxylmethyltransferase family protein [Rhodopila sp.]HVZ10207.1 isoprenylcysteine carboxylmethyltransferase family protein [Rhodopila sp.]
MALSQSSLPARAARDVAIVLIVMAVLLFGSAGTLAWWPAWLFLAVYLAWTALTSRWLFRHDRALFERRMRGGPLREPDPRQKIIMTLASIGFGALLVLPGLDRRFLWSHASAWLPIAGNLLLSAGWIGILLVFRENSFGAATVEVMPGQTVISSGPYAVVRHPMYAVALLMLAGIPLALGSWRGLAAFLLIIPALIWRLLEEERLLTRDLPGYPDYTRKVRYRLVPGVW